MITWQISQTRVHLENISQTRALFKKIPEGCCFLRSSSAWRQWRWRLQQGRATWHVATVTGDKGLHIAGPIGASRGAWKRWFDQRLQHLHFCKRSCSTCSSAVVAGRRHLGWRFGWEGGASDVGVFSFSGI